MIDDRGQLAMAGGRMPAASGQASANASGYLFWIQTRATPAGMLAFAHRHRRLLWLVVLLFYLAAFNGQWRIQPDAALYLSIGRNLATGKGFTYLGQPNQLAYPGWPAIIAGAFKMFGNGSGALSCVNAIMLLMALATVAMVYRLFLLYAGRPTAVAMSVGVGLTKAFFCYGFELWSDMPFALGAMSTLAGYEGLFGRTAKGNEKLPGQTRWVDWLFFGGGILIAGSMRPTIWPLIAAVVISMTIQAVLRQIPWRTFLILSAIAMAVVGAVVAICWSRGGIHGFGGLYEEYLFNRISGRSQDGISHPFTANIRDLFSWAASDVLFQARLGPVCNALLSALVLAFGFGLFRFRLLWGFWFTFLLATVLISQETLDRYFLPVLPLLVYAWWAMLLWVYRICCEWSAELELPSVTPSLVFLFLIVSGCLMNLTKVGGIIIQQRERPFLASYDNGQFDVAPQFSRLLHDQVGENSITLAAKPYGRVTEYLSDRYVVGALGTQPSLLQHHPVFVVEPSDLSIQQLLRSAGLVEGPALFKVSPPANHGSKAIILSLHSTHVRN